MTLDQDSMRETPLSVETVKMTMRFGGFTALDDVSIKIAPGTFHALLGENGAGKSTLVKCMMGFYTPTSGQLLVNDREADIKNPRDAHTCGLGMVYQHFTLVPSLTAAENIVIARDDVPAVIDWKRELDALHAFQDTMPFKVPLSEPVGRLSAGEKQKLELLKQLFLGRRFLILDEPTSVLTPAEAGELLGMVRDLIREGALTCLMITHKFREVMAFADSVSVLRRGRYAGGGKVSDLTPNDLGAMMIGDKTLAQKAKRTQSNGENILRIEKAVANDRSGLKTISIDDLTVSSGEIVGIAGISGNGQMELVEILTGQRPLRSGTISVKDTTYRADRRQARDMKIRFIPEEPLKNASAPKMSVAENLAFRSFDHDDGAPRFWLNTKRLQERARDLIEIFNVKTASEDSPIASLSGGNVQRATLARELSEDVDLLIVANPCFGLDFSSVADIRARLIDQRNQGAAVLLISEDLDEILELSDRILVMSEGRIAFESPVESADIKEIGQHMAGHA